MNTKEKNRIATLRKTGISYKKISQILNLNENTVKSYCRRNAIPKTTMETKNKDIPKDIPTTCKNCNKPLFQYPGRKKKLFCCDACRINWWNTHLALVDRKAMYDFICPTCGKQFSSYGNRNRKYCSHECYIAARFGILPCD